MDFRQADPQAISWATWSRGQPAARTAQGGKIVVQTPLCPCRVSLQGGGMYRIDLVLRPDVALHSEFADWLCVIEEGAAEAEALKAWRGARGRSTCVYNNSMRLMAFSDTLVFDSSGKLSGDLLSAAGCSCIIELQGGWSTDSRWGLRWKIVQCKFVEEVSLAPAGALDDEPEAPGPANFAFLDD